MRTLGVALAASLGVVSVTVAAFARPPSELDPDAPGALDALDAGAAAPAAPTPVDDAAPPPPPLASAVPVEADAPPPPPSSSAAPPAAAPAGDAPPPEPSPTGINFGFRGGYGVPFGNAKTVRLGDVVGGALGFALDLGYFLDRHIYIGGYFSYGLGLNVAASGVTCPTVSPDDSCSASVIHFGAVARWHFKPEETWDPWAGVGFGYEVVNLSENDSTGIQAATGSLHGFELLNLQGGIDYKPRPFYGVGPFVELSLGHYAYDGSSTQLHGWATFGLRLRTGI